MGIVMLAVMTMLVIQNRREKPRPSSFRLSLWAESVRKRGLSEDEALREYALLWPARNAARLEVTSALCGLCPRCMHTAHDEIGECKACYCRSATL